MREFPVGLLVWGVRNLGRNRPSQRRFEKASLGLDFSSAFQPQDDSALVVLFKRQTIGPDVFACCLGWVCVLLRFIRAASFYSCCFVLFVLLELTCVLLQFCVPLGREGSVVVRAR